MKIAHVVLFKSLINQMRIEPIKESYYASNNQNRRQVIPAKILKASTSSEDTKLERTKKKEDHSIDMLV